MTSDIDKRMKAMERQLVRHERMIHALASMVDDRLDEHTRAILNIVNGVAMERRQERQKRKPAMPRPDVA
jgi:hypothetical protein